MSTLHHSGMGVDAELRLSMHGQDLAGSRHITLLAEIERLGSLTHAAKAAGFSYRGAWNAVEQMSNLAGEPLLERSAGGKGGGHTRLTERGSRLVHNFALIQQEHARFIARINRQALGLLADYPLTEGPAMRTSARNQFGGTIGAIRPGSINDEIELEIIGGQHIVATVTRESCLALGLVVGAKAFALVKASAVVLLAGGQDVKRSERNQFRGRISRLTEGAVNSEVVLELPGGGTVAAVVTASSATSLGLTVGVEAVAAFNASSVIMGVAA